MALSFGSLTSKPEDAQTPTYHDLFLSKLTWDKTDAATSTPLEIKSSKNPEPFTPKFNPDAPQAMDMTNTNIVNTNLAIDQRHMLKDLNADYSIPVSDPYGYGYISTLNDTRNKDAKDIQAQENTIFALGAIAGISLIVVGLLVASSSDITPTTSQ